MFDPIYEWIKSSLTNIQTAINAAVAAITGVLDSLNPWHFIPIWAAWLAGWLPLPYHGTDTIAGGMLEGARLAVKYIGFLDYVINLPALLIVVGIMLLTETALLLLRLWRVVRSLVT